MVAVWAVVVFLEALNTVGQDSPNLFPSNALPGAAYNVTLVTDSAPDLTDIDIRLKALRDAIQDYEYLAILQRSGKAAEAQELVRSLTQTFFQWEKDPVA
jgi:hypothetical protein